VARFPGFLTFTDSGLGRQVAFVRSLRSFQDRHLQLTHIDHKPQADFRVRSCTISRSRQQSCAEAGPVFECFVGLHLSAEFLFWLRSRHMPERGAFRESATCDAHLQQGTLLDRSIGSHVFARGQARLDGGKVSCGKSRDAAGKLLPMSRILPGLPSASRSALSCFFLPATGSSTLRPVAKYHPINNSRSTVPMAIACVSTILIQNDTDFPAGVRQPAKMSCTRMALASSA